MAKVGFIGLGNMGGPMVRNLIKAGHSLKVYDLSEEAINFAVQAGAMATKSVKEASSEVEFVVTMVPVGSNVKEIFLENGILTAASPGTVMIDSSTIDVQSAQTVHEAAKSAGFNMIDAPVSGGVIGADAGTLTFMCGGDKESFEKAKPILQGMGKNIVHCGSGGLGQATKICNNMLAGINALAAAEAMTMGERLGVSPEVLYEVIATSTGRSYIFETSNPMPNVCSTSPANNEFKPGFMAKLMLKDLRLSQAAAQDARTSTPLGAAATAAFQQLIDSGFGDLDTSSIIKMIRPESK